jgi:hypothetical protein
MLLKIDGLIPICELQWSGVLRGSDLAESYSLACLMRKRPRQG